MQPATVYVLLLIPVMARNLESLLLSKDGISEAGALFPVAAP